MAAPVGLQTLIETESVCANQGAFIKFDQMAPTGCVITTSLFTAPVTVAVSELQTPAGMFGGSKMTVVDIAPMSAFRSPVA